ncbi:MAG: tetratricopeptide repeat protein, partial [Hyphomonas sp.]|nr:tetratricopeptide repeat protein [Hyphomonas sp.]
GGFEIATLTKVGYRLKVEAPDAATAGSQGLSSTAPGQMPVIVDGVPFVALTADEPATSFASILFDEFVIALTLYRDFAVRLAGAAPGAGFRITGSIRPAGERMQASLRVLDPSGGVVFAQRFDVDWTGADQPLDDFVVAGAGALTGEIVRAETERALRKTSDLTAWEAVVRSVSAYSSINIANLDFAVTEARRALEIDPGYPEAHAALANALAGKFEVGGGLDKALAEESAREIEMARSLGRDRPDVLARVATALSMIGRPGEALPYARRAVELNPGGAIGHLYLARVLIRLQQPAEALFHIARFDHLSPRAPIRYFNAFQKSLAHFMLGDLARSEAALSESLVLNPDYTIGWMARAVFMSVTGRIDEAAAAVSHLIALEGPDSFALQCARIHQAYPDSASAGLLVAAFERAWTAALVT